MDAKELVKLIRDSYIACSPKNRAVRSFRIINDILPADRERVADYIEQQEKYAELGRLAIADFKENMDNIRDFTDKNEANLKFIEKRSEIYKSERAELLKVEGCE